MNELFSVLEAEYDEDFNWRLIPESNTYFLTEAYREIHANHPLFGYQLKSIANAIQMMMYYSFTKQKTEQPIM